MTDQNTSPNTINHTGAEMSQTEHTPEQAEKEQATDTERISLQGLPTHKKPVPTHIARLGASRASRLDPRNHIVEGLQKAWRDEFTPPPALHYNSASHWIATAMLKAVTMLEQAEKERDEARQNTIALLGLLTERELCPGNPETCDKPCLECLTEYAKTGKASQ